MISIIVNITLTVNIITIIIIIIIIIIVVIAVIQIIMYVLFSLSFSFSCNAINHFLHLLLISNSYLWLLWRHLWVDPGDFSGWFWLDDRIRGGHSLRTIRHQLSTRQNHRGHRRWDLDIHLQYMYIPWSIAQNFDNIFIMYKSTWKWKSETKCIKQCSYGQISLGKALVELSWPSG